MTEVATGYVRLRPDTTGFQAEAQAQLTPELRAIQTRIAGMRAQADALASRVEANRAARDAGAGVALQATQFGTLAARASVAAAAIVGVKDVIQAASAREVNFNLVEQSLSNAGQAWGTYRDQVTEALDAQRRATGFAATDIAQGFARLEQTVKDPTVALKDLAVAEDVARARGISLEQVTASIAQALEGQVGNLNSLGVITEKVTARQDALRAAHAALLDSGTQLTHAEQQQYQDRLRAAQAADNLATGERALAELQARNAGQAQAYLNTTRGQIGQLRTSLTELEEQVGGPLSVAFGDFASTAASGIEHLVGGLSALGTGINTVTSLLGDAHDSTQNFSRDFAAAVAASQTAGTRNAGLERLVVLLREASKQADAAGHFGKNSLDVFSAALAEIARENPALAKQAQNLDGIVRAAGGLDKLSDLTIRITLDPRLDSDALTQQILDTRQKILDSLAAPLSQAFDFTKAGALPGFEDFSKGNNLTPFPGERGGHAAATKVKAKAKKDAVTYSTEFVQSIDASGIAQSLVDAIDQARSQVQQQATGLASSIGDVLDARLARSERALDTQAKAIQDRITAREAAATARSTSLATNDAATKLKELQDVLGTGALTADQQLELQAAKNAVLDAQDAIATAKDQTQADAVSARKTALEQQEELEKTAANRRISDLTSELNRGLITQAAYVKGVRGLLDKEQVSYKSAGALLGTAFADGFRDSLKGVIDQAKALGLVGTTTLKGKPTSPTAVNPLREQAKAAQSVVDQIAGSGGRFNLTGVDKLPPGVTVASLLAAAGATRSETAYRQRSDAKVDQSLHYVGLTADHTKAILDELKKANAKPPVVVSDGSKAKAKHAQATR